MVGVLEPNGLNNTIQPGLENTNQQVISWQSWPGNEIWYCKFIVGYLISRYLLQLYLFQLLVVLVLVIGCICFTDWLCSCICWLVVGCAPLVRPDRRAGGSVRAVVLLRLEGEKRQRGFHWAGEAATASQEVSPSNFLPEFPALGGFFELTDSDTGSTNFCNKLWAWVCACEFHPIWNLSCWKGYKYSSQYFDLDIQIISKNITKYQIKLMCKIALD